MTLNQAKKHKRQRRRLRTGRLSLLRLQDQETELAKRLRIGAFFL
jgi:hypothetical protein